MDWKAILLGSIQGLTEFLPISSSAHLIFLHRFFFQEEASLWFDVLLHGGTWFAVLIYLFPSYRRVWKTPSLVGNVLLATLPAGFLGYLLEEMVESYFRNQLVLIASILMVLGIVFLWQFPKGDRTLSSLSPWEALLVGSAQALALFPGVSRSGITLIVLLSLGFERSEAVFFSFLLSITTIGGAFLKGLFHLATFQEPFNAVEIGSGFASAFLVGLLACFVLLKTVRVKGLRPFGYYRIVVGVGILLLLFLVKT